MVDCCFLVARRHFLHSLNRFEALPRITKKLRSGLCTSRHQTSFDHPIPYLLSPSAAATAATPAVFPPVIGSFFPISPAPYHAITPTPKNAHRQLNTNATMPLASNPAGNGGGGLCAPLKSNRSTVLPAALPSVGNFSATQLSM